MEGDRKREAGNPLRRTSRGHRRRDLAPPSRNHQAAASLFPDLEFFSSEFLGFWLNPCRFPEDLGSGACEATGRSPIYRARPHLPPPSRVGTLGRPPLSCPVLARFGLRRGPVRASFGCALLFLRLYCPVVVNPETTLRKLERKARIGHAGAEQVNYDDSFVSESVYYELPMNVNGSSFFSFEEMCQISLRMSSLWHWIEVLCKLKRKTSEMNFVH